MRKALFVLRIVADTKIALFPHPYTGVRTRVLYYLFVTSSSVD